MKVENMTYNAKTAFTERREIIDKLNECINSINTYGPEKIAGLESKNEQQDTDITNLFYLINKVNTKITNIETKNVNQDTDIDNLNTKITNIETKNVNQDADIDNLKNGDTNIGGIKEFIEPIRGRVINVLYAENSGYLPSGKYRQFAKIPATSPDSMIVLDVMTSGNANNYGFGRLIIGNPTATTWFCQWVYRESNGVELDVTDIQIARETASGDLMIFAKNPVVTGLVVNLVYSKYGFDIQDKPRVEKVTNTIDYSLDGTDAGIENIIPGSDTNNVKINKINEYAVGLTGNQDISGVKNFVSGISAYPNDWHDAYIGGGNVGDIKLFAKLKNQDNGKYLIFELIESANAGICYGILGVHNINSPTNNIAWFLRKGFGGNNPLQLDSIVIASDGTNIYLGSRKKTTFGRVMIRVKVANNYTNIDANPTNQIEWLSAPINIGDGTGYTLTEAIE